MYLLQGQGSGFLHNGGSYVTLTNGSDFTIVIEKMAWAHSQWSVVDLVGWLFVPMSAASDLV